jgi:hypothetical protein
VNGREIYLAYGPEQDSDAAKRLVNLVLRDVALSAQRGVYDKWVDRDASGVRAASKSLSCGSELGG